METPFLLTNNRAELNYLAHAYPSECGCWVYGSDTPIAADKIGDMAALCRQFASQWEHHGQRLRTAWILHRQSFLIPLTFPGSVAGGCSQDELAQHMRNLGYMIGGNWMNPQRVSWLEEEQVQSTERILFKQKLKNGELKADSIVFDTTITNLEALQAGKLETIVQECWMAQWLPKSIS